MTIPKMMDRVTLGRKPTRRRRRKAGGWCIRLPWSRPEQVASLPTEGLTRPGISFLVDLFNMADAWSDFGLRCRSDAPNNGDPFPLPRLTWAAQRRGGPAQELRERVGHSFKTLNDLAAAPFQTANLHLPLTSVQEWIMEDVWRRVASHGGPPDLDADEALQQMTAKANLYSQEAAHLVATDLSKIKILHRRLGVKLADDLLQPEVSIYLKNYQCFIEKSPAELEADVNGSDPVEPYWDPGLRSDWGRRFELYRALDSSSLLTFKRRRKGRVAFFTVAKKDGMQRLIVAARDANAKQKRPPCTQLSTLSGFMDLDFADFVDGVGEVMELPAFALSAGDVGDCFYNFSVAPLASYFCTDDRASVSDLRKLGFNVGPIYDDELGGFVQPSDHEQLWFAFGGMAMGRPFSSREGSLPGCSFWPSGWRLCGQRQCG